MKIVFMGTPEFAVPSLEMLVREGYEVVAVITQPDKPKGRGNKLTAPPVKEYALSKGIRVIQPEKVRTPEFEGLLKEIGPDLFVTVAYGRILPKNILAVPSHGCINVHGSMLPKYRGAAPLHWAIINGEQLTGITTMYTDEGMDTGDMLLKKSIEIDPNMTVGELHDPMSLLGAEVLKETILKLKMGTLKRTPQPNAEATYAPIMGKDVGLISWLKTSGEIHNLVRGTNPWPGAYTFYKGERMRVWKTELIYGADCLANPGTILAVSKDGISVSTGKGLVRIVEIQFDSSRKMTVEGYICGHRIDEGEVLG